MNSNVKSDSTNNNSKVVKGSKFEREDDSCNKVYEIRDSYQDLEGISKITAQLQHVHSREEKKKETKKEISEVDDEQKKDDISNEEALISTCETHAEYKVEKIMDKSENDDLSRGRPSSCVFVASLCSSKSDDELCMSVTKHFAQWGKLGTVKVLRDPSDRPYAFVQYSNDEDAKNAIKNGQNSYLDGRALRCEAAKVNRTIFVTSKSVRSEATMNEILSEFGGIEQIIPSDEVGNLKKKGLVKVSRSWFCKYAYRDDAIRAFANLSESSILNVEWAQNIEQDSGLVSNKIFIHSKTINSSKQKHHDLKMTFDKYSVFVGQLSSTITEEEIAERFKCHGKIEEITIVKKPTNTFAFVKYYNESSAASAVERENHSMFKERTMHVQYREIHVSGKPSKPNGVMLAPPPINLNKKQNSTRKSMNLRKGVPFGNSQIYTMPFAIPSKHNNIPPNILRSRNNYNGTRNENLPLNILPSVKKTNQFDSWEKLRPEMKEESPTPPESVQTVESHNLTKSAYSGSSAMNSEKSEGVGNHLANFRNNMTSNNVPYFYYIPTSEVIPPNTTSSFYNPYHYFVPYEGHEYSTHNGYGIPFPVYFAPTNQQEYGFEETYENAK